MSPVLPFEIIDQIIDIVGDNNDTNVLKDLALVSHSFHQICSKHLFATIDLHDANPNYHRKSSKKGFMKLLESRPDVANYIRKLTYNLDGYGDDSKLPKLLRTISRLNSLAFTASQLDWYMIDRSLTSALLYLMHLPTINHIDLSIIQNFPLSSLPPSVNLLRLDIFYLCRYDRHEVYAPLPEIVILSDMMPKIREFNTSESTVLTTKLLHAKRQDGLPAFNFMDLRQVSMSFTQFEDEHNIRYLLQNAKLLENFSLFVGNDENLLGLRDILSHSARTLKVLGFEIPLYASGPLAGLCEVLEVMEGNNMLEALSFQVNLEGQESKDLIGSVIQNVEHVLVGPGWPSLMQVSLKVSIACCLVSKAKSAALSEALQSLPNEYLGRLSQLQSIVFNFSASVHCGPSTPCFSNF